MIEEFIFAENLKAYSSTDVELPLLLPIFFKTKEITTINALRANPLTKLKVNRFELLDLE